MAASARDPLSMTRFAFHALRSAAADAPKAAVTAVRPHATDAIPHVTEAIPHATAAVPHLAAVAAVSCAALGGVRS
ncbi:hypothetical protein GCM10010361_29820 [Streptomyces olivaceiscleroticus]|uniref:Uncharacterized protein n=2 Tax=Streptomyces olivaceiscleroticus TaxID=68245 RepID=A0ABN0ZZK7_9ACTN